MNYTNTTTYTCATNEQGTRYERTTRIESNKPLTATGTGALSNP